MSYRINHSRYFYEFQNTINIVKREQGYKCFICGSTDNLGPHHIKKVKQSNALYASKENVVILCRKCHNRYHNKYSHKQIGPKTFALFVKQQQNKEINKLIVERNTLGNQVKKLTLEINRLEGKMKNTLVIDDHKVVDIDSYECFCKYYNDYTISTDAIIRVLGTRKYKNYRKKALSNGDIKQRPYGLRFK